MANIHKIFLAFLATILFASCSPRVIEKVEYRNDTIFQTKYQRDSIFLRDSVSVSIHASNDTVFYTKYKTTIRYKECLKTDTVKQIKEIVKKDTKVIEVKKKNWKFLPFVYGFLLGGFLMLILLCRNYKMK